MNTCSAPTDKLPSQLRFYRFEFHSSFIVDSVTLNAVSFEAAMNNIKAIFSDSCFDFIRTIRVID